MNVEQKKRGGWRRAGVFLSVCVQEAKAGLEFEAQWMKE